MQQIKRKILPSVKDYVLLFLLGGSIFTVTDYLIGGFSSTRDAMVNFLSSGLFFILVWIGNAQIAERVKISWVEYPIRRFLVSLVLTVVYTYLICVFFNMLVYYLCCGILPWELDQPVYPMFRNVLIVTLLISGFMHGRGFLYQYKMSLLEAERLKQTALASRFESLKNQVNPHFLFNSFNVLSNLVYKDPDLAAKFIKQLSIVYRYVLDTRNQEVVSLTTELEVLESYIFLIQIRFGENLKIRQELQRDEQTYIAPFTLQMLLENAVKHNVVSRAHPLQVQFFRENDYIVVRNNLHKKSNVQNSSGIGLANIEERYRYISGKEVKILETEDIFQVEIPLVKVEEQE